MKETLFLNANIHRIWNMNQHTETTAFLNEIYLKKPTSRNHFPNTQYYKFKGKKQEEMILFLRDCSFV